MRRSILALGFGVLLAACQSGPTGSSLASGDVPTSAATALPTLTAAASPAGSPVVAGITMPLLSNWQEVELTRDSLQNMVTTLGPTNPQLAAALTQLLASGQFSSFLLYALGYNGAAYIGNLNVTSFPVGPLDLDGIGPLMEGQLKNVGVANFVSTKVSLPGGDALSMQHTLTIHAATGDVKVSGHAYIFLTGGQAYQVTFSCNPPDPAACLAQGDQMIQGFRVGG